jgi:hypothetical protein
MSLRLLLLLAGCTALVAVGGCSAAPGAHGPSSPVPSSPPATPSAVRAPDPTRVPAATVPPEPTATPIVGDVVGDADGPELTVVPIDATTIAAGLEDPAAKAWRVEVRGIGAQAGDSWLITVETGDVAPVITATEIVGGETVGELDLSGMWDDTAVAGGCHSTLPVCLDSEGFRLPDHGDGTFAIRLHLADAGVALEVRGATAYWEGEPFILGPWHETTAFPWTGAG